MDSSSDGERGALPSTNGTSTTYENTHKITGVALMICNRTFTPRHPGNQPFTLTERKYAHEDFKRLSPLLKQLGFDVRIHYDKTGDEMKHLIQTVSQETLTADSDCFLCILSSHGKYVLSWSVSSYQDNVEIERNADGAVIEAEREQFIGFDITHVGGDGPIPIHPNVFQIPYRLGVKKDILLHCSTCPGFVSFRSGTSGTPFLKAWYDILQSEVLDKKAQGAPSVDLLSLTTLVNAKVAEYSSNAPSSQYQGAHNRKQMSQVVSMLTRDFYFDKDKIVTQA